MTAEEEREVFEQLRRMARARDAARAERYDLRARVRGLERELRDAKAPGWSPIYGK